MKRRLVLGTAVWVAILAAAAGHVRAGVPPAQATATAPVAAAPATEAASPQRALLNQYCVSCHNQRMTSGGLDLAALDVTRVDQSPAVWEKVVRKLRAGLMPPAGRPRPDEGTYDGFRTWLEGQLDHASAVQANPGRTELLHRLNRTEYQNAIRDLLMLDIDVTDFLPADDSSYGFDNIAGVLKVSQSLMERYLAAARTVSRMAVGTPLPAVGSKMFRVAPDAQQHERVDELPIGTRGGTLIHYAFPQDGEYVIKVDVGGAAAAGDTQNLEVTVDGVQVKLFTLTARNRSNMGDYEIGSGTKFEVRTAVKAGPRDVGVAFYRRPPDLIEQTREPFENPRVSGNDGGPGGAQPYVTVVTIGGPYSPTGPGETPSRGRIFACYPSKASENAHCAKTILTRLARRAYRGFGTAADLQVLVDFYDKARAEGGNFDTGIEFALRRMLVDPLFLFRIEADPTVAKTSGTAGVVGGVTHSESNVPTVGRVTDLQLASRLSFFLWSSIPDDELLDAATQGKLTTPAVLEHQVRRMLADPRSSALTTDFAAQWLLLRNLGTVRPGEPYLLAWDETLRQAMQRETELFFDSIVRENRSAIDLLTANYTFLNERLARHYGVPNIQGSHFRRVEWPADSPRRGLLGQGSILTLTSHAIRTSPVIRGKWILNNILGTPPPDPPANVPALVDRKTQAKVQTMRDQMSAHRANPVCSACHSMIDPAGFALERFDAIGRWREVDESYNAIDASGALPDGTKFEGVVGLRDALARRPERFVTTVTEKLLTYALGRGLDFYDMPAVRTIVKEAAREDYKFQALVVGVARSYPFLNRRTDVATGGMSAAAR
jgi:cytochrome c553